MFFLQAEVIGELAKDDQRKLTRTPSKTESTYLEYGKLPLPDLKKILDLGPP